MTVKMYELSQKFDGFNPDKICDIADILLAKCMLNSTQLDKKCQKLYLAEILKNKTKVQF